MADVALDRFQKVPLAQRLTEGQVNSLLPRVREIELAKDDVLFSQGETLTFVYYVEQGEVKETGVEGDGRSAVPRVAQAGDYLGRYALVTGQPARVTAVAQDNSTLLAIPLRDLQPILFSYKNWHDWFFNTDVATRLRSMPWFKDFDDWDLYFLADRVEAREYATGDTIFHASEGSDGIYVVERGQVIEEPPAASPTSGWPKYFATGNFFGGVDPLSTTPRGVTAMARLPSRVLHISRKVLKELKDAGVGNLEQNLTRIDIAGHLKQIEIFSSLDDVTLRLLSGYVSLIYYQAGEIVSRQGDPATSLMILVEGEAIVRRQMGQGQPRPVAYLKAHPGHGRSSVQAKLLEIPHFGEHALLSEEIRGATVEITESSTWIVLNRGDFERFRQDSGLEESEFEDAARPTAAALPAHPADVDRLQLPFRTRRHWIRAVRQVSPAAAALALVAGLLALDVLLTLPPLLRTVGLVGGTALITLLVPWTIWRYINWRNDYFEVTSEAVLHVERVPFPFPREDRYKVPLVQIQNVTINVSVPGQLLGYGNLSLDTAAIQGEVSFSQIPHPALVQDLIQRAAREARSGQETQFRQSIRQRLEDQFKPQRLRPESPESVLLPSEAPPPPSPPSPVERLRSPRGWFPRFEIREPGRVTWRKHWINLVYRTGLPFLAFLATTYLLFANIVFYLATTLFQATNPLRLPPVSWLGFNGGLFLAFLVLWIVSVLWLVYQYVDWRNDVYIVTDNEVIDVERDLAIFPLWFIYTESRRQGSLDKVQNVNLRIPNLWATLLGFGDVIIQTAGTEGTMDFLFVSNPRRVLNEILNRVAAHREREREEEFQNRWGGMAEWFEAYQEIQRQRGD